MKQRITKGSFRLQRCGGERFSLQKIKHSKEVSQRSGQNIPAVTGRAL